MTTSVPGQNVGPGNSNAPYGGAGGQYTRPDQASDYQPRPVAAPGPSALTGTPTEQIYAIFEHAQREHVKFVESVDRERYSASGLQSQLAAFEGTAAAKAVDKAEAAARAREAAAQADVAKVTASLSVDGDVAAELRAGRYWARTQRSLDAVEGAGVIVEARKMLASADRQELSVLLQEIEPYLAAKGVPTEWLPNAVAEVAPELAAAQRKLTLSTQAAQIAASNSRRLRESFKTGTPVRGGLVKPTNYDADK